MFLEPAKALLVIWHGITLVESLGWKKKMEMEEEDDEQDHWMKRLVVLS